MKCLQFSLIQQCFVYLNHYKCTNTEGKVNIFSHWAVWGQTTVENCLSWGELGLVQPWLTPQEWNLSITKLPQRCRLLPLRAEPFGSLQEQLCLLKPPSLLLHPRTLFWYSVSLLLHIFDPLSTWASQPVTHFLGACWMLSAPASAIHFLITAAHPLIRVFRSVGAYPSSHWAACLIKKTGKRQPK